MVALPKPQAYRSIAGVETLREVEEKRAAEQKRKAVEDAKKAEFVEAFQQWEWDAYIMGKEITMRTCGTKERWAANMAKFGYNMDSDPRFNGEHAAKGYDGVGPDPC